MIKIILLNILLFIFFILAFATGAFFLNSAAVAGYQTLTTLIYIAAALLHLLVNYLLLRKWKFPGSKPLIVSCTLIIAAYIINLFLYK